MGMIIDLLIQVLINLVSGFIQKKIAQAQRKS